MTDLGRLIEAVEAGAEPVDLWLALGSQWNIDTAQRAYRGSLDAALRLHEALLPGWTWELARHAACVRPLISEAENNGRIFGAGSNPARALLIAILRAVKAQQEAGK